MAQKEEEQEKLPKGLAIENKGDGKQATITLGDGVDLNKIIEYLRNKNIVSQLDDGQKTELAVKMFDKSTYNSVDFFNVNQDNIIIFTIKGKNNNDKYSVSRDSKDQHPSIIKTKDGTIALGAWSSTFVSSDKIEWCTPDKHYISHYICKDKAGDLSWYQVRQDGKVYMHKHLIKKQQGHTYLVSDNDCHYFYGDEFKPIKHTYGSNIKAWWEHNIDDYDKIEEDDRPSSMKRLGRVLIGQDNMTGECLWGHGCLSCCGSGLNEEPFYSTINVNNDKIKAS